MACARMAWIASSSCVACVCDSCVRASVAVGALVPDVPTAPCVAAVVVAADCVAVVPAALVSGVAGLADDVAGGVDAVGVDALDEAVDPPAGVVDEAASGVFEAVGAALPAACSNAFRCVRNSTSFARIAD